MIRGVISEGFMKVIEGAILIVMRDDIYHRTDVVN